MITIDIPNIGLAQKWWSQRDWPPIPKEMLPKNGYMINWDGRPICQGWLYLTDSNMSLIGWVVSDPEAREGRDECLDMLFKSLMELSRNEGRSLITMYAAHPKLLKRLEKHGFSESDKGYSFYMAKV